VSCFVCVQHQEWPQKDKIPTNGTSTTASLLGVVLLLRLLAPVLKSENMSTQASTSSGKVAPLHHCRMSSVSSSPTPTSSMVMVVMVTFW
jgi:hypothetical protein